MKAIIVSIIGGVFSVVVLFAAVSSASVSVGDIAYGGTGCVPGSITVVSNEQDGEFEIVFDNFIAQSEGHKPSIARKSCSFSIPIQGEAGFQFALATYGEGYASISRGQATFNQEVFVAGSSGPTVQKTFVGPLDESFDTLGDVGSDLAWSECGASVNLRANMSLVTQGVGFASLDHLFLKVLQVRPCLK